MNKTSLLPAVAIAWLGLGGPYAVGATDSTPPEKSSLRRWAEQDYLFGDWGGLRRELSEHGVDFEFFYAGSMPDNLSGGLRSGAIYQGGLLMALDLDSEKLLGYEGGTLQVSGLWLHGHKPFSAEYVGDLNRVNLLDFDDTARFWEYWYQQKFCNNRLALKVGKLSIDRDFIVPEYYGTLGDAPLVNQTFFFPTLPFDLFDIPGLPSHGHGLATTPLSAPGALLRWNVTERTYLQAGAYGGNPDQSYSGSRFDLSADGGMLNFFELGVNWNRATNQPALGGSLKIGGYYHTGDFGDVYDGVTWAAFTEAGYPEPPVRKRSGNYGAYLLAEQQLFLEQGKADPARQGLLGFFRLLGAPADRNLAQLQVDGGLVFRGLIPTRDWDTLAFAVSYLAISDDIRHAQRDLNLLAPGTFVVADHETALELSYKIQATAWWTLQPSLQHVIHPGGSAATPDATVFILQSTLRF